MKILATGSINVAEIPKHKLIKGAKGMYLNYKILINSAPDQFAVTLILSGISPERYGTRNASSS